MSASALAAVKKLVAENTVMVFSKDYCPYCQKVKGLFSKILEPSVSYKVVELNLIPEGDSMQAALFEMTKQRTVPNVFVNGKHIGGCDSTHALHNEGKLLPLINNSSL